MDPNSGQLYTPDEMAALDAERRSELVELRATKEQAEHISRAVAELAAREQVRSALVDAADRARTHDCYTDPGCCGVCETHAGCRCDAELTPLRFR